MKPDQPTIRIWDIWVRIFHWSLAIAVIFLLFSGATGFLFIEWHRLAGEVVLALLVFRLFWGILGSGNARLLGLFKSPKNAVVHMVALFRRTLPLERSHNAAGGWAVLILLLSLSIQAVTGLFIADEDEFIEGALYGDISSSYTDLFYRIHHMNAEFLQILVIIHVAMVLVYLIYGRRNLITPMITGMMAWTSQQQPASVFFQRNWLGVVFIVIAMATVGFLVGWF